MKKTNEQDQILKEILRRTEIINAPESIKSGILNDINGLSIPAKQSRRLPGVSILIVIALILLFCMIWALTTTTGIELNLPSINAISIQPNFDKWITQTGQFFDNLFDINLRSQGTWIYYLGGGLILFWFYILVTMVLDKLTQSKSNYSV